MYTEKEYGIRIGFHFYNGFAKDYLPDETRPVLAISSTGNVDRLNFLNRKILTDITTHNWWVEISQRNIIYDENEITLNPIKYDSFYNLTPMGAIKERFWSFETESRLVALFRTTKDNIDIPDYDYLLVPIIFNNLKGLSITFSPWMIEEMKECIKHEIQYLKLNCPLIDFMDSLFQGKIIRK
jgi:hypothetical protein